MNELTKAEEQLMQYIWKLKKSFLKEIVELFPEPRPAYTTISTVIRVLVKKGFLGYNTYGKIHEYYPLISKKDYFKSHMKRMVQNFFNGSTTELATYFTDSEDINLTELEEIKRMVEAKIQNIKDGTH